MSTCDTLDFCLLTKRKKIRRKDDNPFISISAYQLKRVSPFNFQLEGLFVHILLNEFMFLCMLTDFFIYTIIKK